MKLSPLTMIIMVALGVFLGALITVLVDWTVFKIKDLYLEFLARRVLKRARRLLKEIGEEQNQ